MDRYSNRSIINIKSFHFLTLGKANAGEFEAYGHERDI